jgi:hypothetical protein
VAAGTLVPIEFDDSVSTSGASTIGGDDDGLALLESRDANGAFHNDFVYDSSLAGANGAYQHAITAVAGDEYSVEEVASIDVLYGFEGTSEVDPTITIDPDFLAANPDVKLIMSPNLSGTVSAAPEPGVWVLMLGGLAIVGGLLRMARGYRREAGVASA